VTCGRCRRPATNSVVISTTTPGPSLHKSLRFGARRAARPAWSGLETRRSVGWPALEIDLIGGSALETHMRAETIVPAEEQGKFAPKGPAKERHDWEDVRGTVLEGVVI